MAIYPPDERISKLIKIFGFDSSDCRSFKLIIKADDIVKIELEKYVDKNEIDKFIYEVEEIKLKQE